MLHLQRWGAPGWLQRYLVSGGLVSKEGDEEKIAVDIMETATLLTGKQITNFLMTQKPQAYIKRLSPQELYLARHKPSKRWLFTSHQNAVMILGSRKLS